MVKLRNYFKKKKKQTSFRLLNLYMCYCAEKLIYSIEFIPIVFFLFYQSSYKVPFIIPTLLKAQLF